MNARLFAVVNAAMGDAGILAWDDKYFYDVWRPVLGIREHDSSTGPAGVGGGVLDVDADPGWLPLGAQRTNNVGKKNVTPPFLAYGTVRPRHVRNFPGGLWQMIEENGRSRVFLGVHWVFDAFAVNENDEIDLTQNIGGARLGIDVANDIAEHGLTASAAAGPRLT